MSAPTMPDAESWLAAITARRSRREFDGRPVADADLAGLEEVAVAFRPFEDARVEVVREAPEDLFRGIVGAYGRVSGAPSALLFIARPDAAHAREHCGYTGEGLVLEAHARGLAACWIGGLFSRDVAGDLVTLAADEAVLCASPLGHPLEHIRARERMVFGAGRPKRRRSPETIAPGWEGWPAWARAGVEAARVAPSAMNRQPWRFAFEGGSVRISAAGPSTPVVGLRLDCGIAMLHFELAARSEGCDGAWEPLEGRDVARWVPVT